jgi:hypothetical protein
MQCDRCGERLIEIDRYGERLTGCIECNQGAANELRLLFRSPLRTFRLFEGLRSMVGKRVQFDEETWEALQAAMRDADMSFQDIADEAFADVLKKHKQPVGLKASLKKTKSPGNTGAVR